MLAWVAIRAQSKNRGFFPAGDLLPPAGGHQDGQLASALWPGGGTVLRFWPDYARELSDDAYRTSNCNWGYYLESLRLLTGTGTGKLVQPAAREARASDAAPPGHFFTGSASPGAMKAPIDRKIGLLALGFARISVRPSG